METNWAAEHLQTIRTLMERSAIYRRALAPIMTFTGVLGIGGALVASGMKIDSARGFVIFWAVVALICLGGAFLLVRRQALKEAEPFWSPPTRRVAHALLAPLFIGTVAGTLTALGGGFVAAEDLPALWMLLYGCALSAAGFFMVRGIKLFGWIFVLGGCGLMAAPCAGMPALTLAQSHEIMGAVFGGLHLAYGIYLYFTEKGKNVA